MNQQPIYRRLFKIPDEYGISISTIRRLIKAKKVKSTKRGRMVFVRTDTIIAYIEGAGD